jgi:hypothetical protein
MNGMFGIRYSALSEQMFPLLLLFPGRCPGLIYLSLSGSTHNQLPHTDLRAVESP